MSLALYLRWFVRVIGPDFETKYESTTFVKSLKVNKSIFRSSKHIEISISVDRSCCQLSTLKTIQISRRDDEGNIDLTDP